MPKIEPILASGTEVSTPSSKHLAVSIASTKSIRSDSSCRSTSWLVAPNSARSPGHSRVRFPSEYS